ncbi:hypothetical protein HDV06_003315 [Boothiomyces sp. JEL0866]|nr:hypothetical protein HDV06_003315 [Boothiomyces sp. JEL0866]
MLLQFIPEKLLQELASQENLVDDEIERIVKNMLPPIPMRNLPTLTLIFVKETVEFSKTNLYRLAQHFHPHLVSTVEIEFDLLETYDFRVLFEQITGNEKVILYAGDYNDILHDKVYQLSKETWTFIDCSKITTFDELSTINYHQGFQSTVK